MKYCVLFVMLLLVGCGDGTGNGTGNAKSKAWETLTAEAAGGNMTEGYLVGTYDVWKSQTPGVYGMGSSDRILTNIWVSENGMVTKCVSWVGSPEDIFWNAMAQVLAKQYGPPFSVQINQVMWASGIELVRPVPYGYGNTLGKVELRWPIGGGE